MKLLYLLLPLLTQWAHCAGNLCLVEAIDGPISARTSYSNVDDALVISEHEAVLVASRESIDVVQIDLGEHVVATLGDVRGNVPPSLVSADDDWWVGRMITDGDGTNVVFATAADTRLHEQRIETGGKPLYWVPVDGQEPSSIIVSVAAQQPALRFAHVTPSGIQQLGSAEWWQTSSRLLISHDSRWSAEALAGGRFVLAALDNPDDAYPLKVWRLDGSSKEFTVPCRMADRPIGTATDGNGMLVAVGISPEDGVVTATFDQEEPDKARCEVLSTPGERVARMTSECRRSSGPEPTSSRHGFAMTVQSAHGSFALVAWRAQ